MRDARGAGGRVFVLSGPGGVGKSTIISRLKGLPGVFCSVSVTTRRPRAGEVDGKDYRFVSSGEFQEMLAAGGFVEHATVAGNLYGTPKAPLEAALSKGGTAVMAIDVQGAAQVKKRFPEATLIFIEPPGMEALAERMKKRGAQTQESIRDRLALALREMECAPGYDFQVVNDDLEKAVAKVRSIMEV